MHSRAQDLVTGPVLVEPGGRVFSREFRRLPGGYLRVNTASP
ncbi:hypothetical protein [Amycolatopsis sp. FDAARGOS 1241]|nr:hypothetical protein [Amycolatopsis sp. FDAARGOS 1241]